MDKIKCYNCNIDDSSFYDKENGYTIVKCNSCGLLYVNPRFSETEINEATKLGVHKGDKELDVTGKYSLKKINRYIEILPLIFSDVKNRATEMTWLDIGGGFGEFIEALNLYFGKQISVEVIEPNAFKCNHAKSRGLAMYSLDYLKYGKKYNVISALNVFSHLPNPVETINEWAKLLYPKGELLIETGDTAKLLAKIHPKPYFLPDHLSFATKDIVVEILKRCNFEIISINYFRSSVYPILSINNFIKETYLGIITRSFKNRYNFFPSNPNIDMWIRARRID